MKNILSITYCRAIDHLRKFGTPNLQTIIAKFPKNSNVAITKKIKTFEESYKKIQTFEKFTENCMLK